MSSVKNAIILGFLFILFEINFSSHHIGVYNSCDAELDASHCLKCNIDKQRNLVGFECLCTIGWFDHNNYE